MAISISTCGKSLFSDTPQSSIVVCTQHYIPRISPSNPIKIPSKLVLWIIFIKKSINKTVHDQNDVGWYFMDQTLIFFVLFNPLNELLDGWFNPIIMFRMGPSIYKLVYNLITSSKYNNIVISIHKYHHYCYCSYKPT